MMFRSLLPANAILLFCVILFVACKSSQSEEGASKNIEEGTIVNVPEMTPRFPGCEEITNPEERKVCADKKLLEYIYQKVHYPQYAIENNVQGRCVISFIIETDGKVSHAKIVKDIGGGCGEASLEVVNNMNSMKDLWVPAMDKGIVVRTLYYLPVNFKLQEKEKK